MKRHFRLLVERVTSIVGIASAYCDRAAQDSCPSIQDLGLELAEYLPAMQTVVEQACPDVPLGVGLRDVAVEDQFLRSR